MSVDLEKIVERANMFLEEPGFQSCTIYSSENREIAYYFDDHLSAHAFQARMQLNGMRASIPDDNQQLVIVTHQ
jgi:hypothetical protein